MHSAFYATKQQERLVEYSENEEKWGLSSMKHWEYDLQADTIFNIRWTREKLKIKADAYSRL